MGYLEAAAGFTQSTWRAKKQLTVGGKALEAIKEAQEIFAEASGTLEQPADASPLVVEDVENIVAIPSTELYTVGGGWGWWVRGVVGVERVFTGVPRVDREARCPSPSPPPPPTTTTATTTTPFPATPPSAFLASLTPTHPIPRSLFTRACHSAWASASTPPRARRSSPSCATTGETLWPSWEQTKRTSR